MKIFFTTQNTYFDWIFIQLRSEQSDTDFCRSDSWFSIWQLRKMVDFIAISCGFFKKCRYNDIQNAREIEKYSKYCTTNEIHWHACVAMDLAPKHGFWTVWKRASQIWYFGLVTTLDVYIMLHTSQFYKLLFSTNTQCCRRHDLLYRVDVDSKYDRCTTYWKLRSRFVTISTPNIDFGIMP